MATNKQNIKDKFRQEEQLPESFSWENMEAGIQEKMNTSVVNTSPSSSKSKYLLLLLLLVSGAASYVFIGHFADRSKNSIPKSVDNFSNVKSTTATQNFDNNVEVNNNNATKSNTTNSKVVNSKVVDNTVKNNDIAVKNQKQISTKTNTASQSLNSSTSNQSVLEKQYTIKNEVLNNNSNSLRDKENNVGLNGGQIANSSNFISKDKTSSPSQNIQQVTTNKNDKTIENSSRSIDNLNQNSNQNIASSNKTEIPTNFEISNLASNDVKQNLVINFLALLPMSPLVYQTNALKIKNKVVPNPKIEQQKEGSKNMLYAFAGGNLGLSKYGTNNVGMLKADYEKDVVDKSFGLGFERKIFGNYSIDAALLYNKIHSNLDYVSMSKYSEQRDNVLLSIEINTITNDTTNRVYGLGTVTGTKTRTVHWNNIETTVNIPITIKRNFNFGKLDLGIGLGPSLNYSLSNTGRTFVQLDSLTTIANDYHKKFYVGATGLTTISYSLSKNFDVGLRASIFMPFGVIENSAATSVRRSLLTGGLYVGYRF